MGGSVKKLRVVLVLALVSSLLAAAVPSNARKRHDSVSLNMYTAVVGSGELSLLLKGGLTVKQFAAAQAQNGFTVWRSYDEPGGFRDQMYQIAADNPQIAKLVKIGTT